MTYHQKYRPQNLSQVIGQSTITAKLTNAITKNQIANAYLFSGSHGTGKTSSARVMAMSLNCERSESPTVEPCGECDTCRAIAQGTALDVVELDAASNNGVDGIRQLIDRVNYASVFFRYKVYIIDECHMLSKSAFNALLKTLEEPPPNVVFILATTEPKKVIPTIRSRCQQYDFKQIKESVIFDYLQEIATQEEIEIEQEALKLLSESSDGGMRDALSMLEQLSLNDGLNTLETVESFLGRVSDKSIATLLQALRNQDIKGILESIRFIIESGKEPVSAFYSLARSIQSLMSFKYDLKGYIPYSVRGEAKHWTIQDLIKLQSFLRQAEMQLLQSPQAKVWVESVLLDSLSLFQKEPEPVRKIEKDTTSDYIAASSSWDNLLQHVATPTRSLLEQKCTLVSFTNNKAVIKAKTKPLLKLLAKKADLLERAFEQAVGTQVVVELVSD